MMAEQKSVEQLIGMGPDELGKYLFDKDFGSSVKSPEINWVGLSEVAALKTLVEDDGSDRNIPNKSWANVAITLFRELSKVYPDHRESFTLSEMNLRASVIVKGGLDRNDEMYDPEAILNWFFLGLPLSVRDAEEKTKTWRQNMDDARLLKKIKARFAVVKLLADNGCIDLTDEIAEWLNLYAKLP